MNDQGNGKKRKEKERKEETENNRALAELFRGTSRPRYHSFQELEEGISESESKCDPFPFKKKGRLPELEEPV